MRWMVPRALVALACQILWSADAHAAAWQHVAVGPGETRFVALAIDPARPDHLVVASDRAVSESTDGGTSWQERFRVPAQTSIAAVAYAPGTPSTLLAATDHGVYASFDGGEEWSRVFLGVGEGQAACTHLAVHPSMPSTALLGTRDGLFASRDGGRRWEAVNLPADAREVIHVAFDPTLPEQL